MEELTPSDDRDPDVPIHLPEGGDDRGDPLRPEIEEEHLEDAPMGDPQQDTELAEPVENLADDDDNESLLSELDETQFDNFDPNDIAIEERPIAVDESNVALLGVHKRKRAEGEERRKKKREGRREKPRKERKRREEDGDFGADGNVLSEVRGSRISKDTERRARRRPSPVVADDENLTPEERRKRALDRKIDEAIKSQNARRRRANGVDLETLADEEVENMRRRMADAAKNDTEALDRGVPAMHKLKLLPEVAALLNRSSIANTLVDPDINLMEAVRFFLEPLNDGSLPAYNIQKEMFTALQKLPINKDALVASGIGKVVLFYTKSPRAEKDIKRQAEKLMWEWTRPLLKLSDDYRKKEYAEASFDPIALSQRSRDPAVEAARRVREQRAAQLKAPVATNRARVEGGLTSYTVVPRNNIPTGAAAHLGRAPGAASEDAFRRMKMKQMGKLGGGRR